VTITALEQPSDRWRAFTAVAGGWLSAGAGPVFAIAFVGAGMVQNFHHYHTISTISGGSQTLTGGPVASQEVIKELGTNGGGFANANSSHPFENPTTWTNWLEIFLLLCISFSLPRTFGTMVGDKRQGRAIVAVMALLARCLD
jgi:potassium-transporting ATPase potassium-binding subunit